MLTPNSSHRLPSRSDSTVRDSATESLRSKQRLKARRQYDKRISAGLCAYSGCSAPASDGRIYCGRHLGAMSERNKQRWKSRKQQGVCIQCGSRPQFWGVRCIVCRELFAKNDHPLPVGARRALKLYREAEIQFEIEQRQTHARFAIRKLLAGGTIKGERARALYLYAGLDTGVWRAYVEVASVMNLSHERVRQLLYHSKLIVSRMLDGNVPWKPLAIETSPGTGRKPKPSCPVPGVRSSINVQAVTS